MIDQIIEEYYPRVYAFALVQVRSEAMAKDIVQDIFLQLIRRSSKLSEINHLESYIFTMTRNAIYRYHQRIQITQDLKSGMLRFLPEYRPVVEEQVEAREMERFMLEIIEQLPDRQREIFKLSRETGLSHKEIAEKLDISPNTVKNHLVQALKTLRSELELLKVWWIVLLVIWI